MSKFYGTLQGSRGQATRCGHQQITVQAASWKRAIQVQLSVDKDGIERFDVTMIQWQGVGDYQHICSGRVGEADSIITHENVTK